MNHKQKVTCIKELIPDENLRHIIFNFDDLDDSLFLTDEGEYLSYFSNMMTFTTILILNIFLTWKRSEKNIDIDGNNSFWRIFNILDKAYDPSKIVGEFIDELIINIEIDHLIDTSDSHSFLELLNINELFKFEKHNNRLSNYIYMLKQKRLSSRVFIKDYNFEALLDCIKMFHYLSQITLSSKKINVFKDNVIQENMEGIIVNLPAWYSFKIKEIDFSYSCIIVNKYFAYYMEDIIVNDSRTFDEKGEKNQSIEMNYVPFGGTDRFKIYLLNVVDGNEFKDEYIISKPDIIENFFLNYDIINITPDVIEGNFFRDYILLNNRYLKELAYVVADSLNQSVKNKIIKKYHNEYKDIFDKMYIRSLYNKTDLIGYRWDEIVLLIFLEDGVYEFIKFLLDDITYNVFIESFKRRFGKDKINSILEQEILIARPQKRINKSISKNTEKELYTQSILMFASKLLTQNVWELEKTNYPATIEDIIRECEDIYAKQKCNINEKKIFLLNTILRVVRFIEVFYSGVFQYAKSKREAILKLEVEGLYYDNYKQFSKEKSNWIDDIRESIIIKNKKIEKINNRMYAINDDSDLDEKLIKSFDRLVKFNEQYSKNHDEKNEILFETLGRRSLFSSKKMKEYLKKIRDAFNSKSTVYLNNIYAIVIDFLLYLKTGKDSIERQEYDLLDIESSIYPIVGQYYSSVTSRDGYRYSYFKINGILNNDYDSSVNIKMIIEDDFDFGYSYYCVPNINRVARVNHNKSYDKIWISPIIIPCSIYLPKTYTKLENLENENDFNDAIKLIYESDEYIYQKLFGSIEVAQKVMPFLLRDPKSKFYKQNYYIVKKDNKIIAIASMNIINGYIWKRSEIYNAFISAAVDIPSTFEGAIKNVSESFSDYVGQNFCQIDDVCVDSDYRHLNIGRSLITYIIKEAELKELSLTLSVYSENHAAYNLYSSLGFIPIITNDLVEGTEKREYIKMVKM